MEDGNFIHDRHKRQRNVPRVLACDKFGPNKIRRNSIVLIDGDRAEGSTFWLQKLIPLFRLKSQVDSSGTEYVFQYYMKCKPASG